MGKLKYGYKANLVGIYHNGEGFIAIMEEEALFKVGKETKPYKNLGSLKTHIEENFMWKDEHNLFSQLKKVIKKVKTLVKDDGQSRAVFWGSNNVIEYIQYHELYGEPVDNIIYVIKPIDEFNNVK